MLLQQVRDLPIEGFSCQVSIDSITRSDNTVPRKLLLDPVDRMAALPNVGRYDCHFVALISKRQSRVMDVKAPASYDIRKIGFFGCEENAHNR